MWCGFPRHISCYNVYTMYNVIMSWVWRWNQDAVVAVDGERVSSTKKSTDESVKDQGVVRCVFWLQRHCPSRICTTWSDGKQLFQQVLARLRDAVRRKRPELWENQTSMLHHYNAPAHASHLIRSYLAKHQTSVVPHPPYSSDLAPADFTCSPNLKPLWKDVVSKP